VSGRQAIAAMQPSPAPVVHPAPQPRPAEPPDAAPSAEARSRTAIVVGAGWAGLAAAVGLTQAGFGVVVLEAAPQPGGRARSLTLAFDGQPVAVDNGQHLLIGAYHSTLALVARVGLAPDTVLARSRLRLTGPDGLDLRAAPLPAPFNLAWGLLTARGLSATERWSMVRAMAALRSGGPASVAPGSTVADWLRHHRQPARLVTRIWQPLCVGALNTPPEHACAQAFAQVLSDALLARAADADFLLPRTTLGDVIPEPAVAWLRARGATVRLRTPVRAVRPVTAGGWQALTDAGPVGGDRIVLAVPPEQVVRLLGESLPARHRAALGGFEHEPIATVWLGWRERLSLPQATMLEERPATGEHGQWLFGREPPADGPVRSLAGVVISAAGRRIDAPDALARAVAGQVASQLGCPAPAYARTIVDKRATIRCSPDRPRIDTDALANTLPGLALAGDWSWHRYPATIESAVRSGDAAAAWLATGVVPAT